MINVIEAREALKEGCDLWIVTEGSSSAWSRRIDWYLNFQIVRAEAHRTPEIPAPLTRVLNENELTAPEISMPTDAPLMIASEKLLPNRQTVVIKSGEGFVEACRRVRASLGNPSTRIFLPETLAPATFTSAWSRATNADSARIDLVGANPPQN